MLLELKFLFLVVKYVIVLFSNHHPSHIDQTNRPLKTNDDETHYQALDDDIPSETQRSASPDEIVRSTDLNINDDNDYNARKEYYLSPLNELKDRIGSRDEPDSSTWEVRNDEN